MTLLFVWNSHPAPCWVREFSPHIPGRHFCTSSRKKVQAIQLPQITGGNPVLGLGCIYQRAQLSALEVFIRAVLSEEAIPEQLCHPSVLAFIVLILQRALVSGSRAHSGGCLGLGSRAAPGAASLPPCPALGWDGPGTARARG